MNKLQNLLALHPQRKPKPYKCPTFSLFMKKSVYDKNYQSWMKGKELGHNYLEKPAMYSKLPKLKGKRVLCLGCGAGEECAYIKSKGAEVIGIDISKEMIKLARKNNPKIEFKIMDMEKLNFPNNHFDLVYSSLVVHYSNNWEKLFNQVKRVLKKNGTFLFSTHNPVYWHQGYYLKPRKINDVWHKTFKVTYYHRTFSLMLKEILNSGFKIEDCLEPSPLKSAKKINRKWYENNNKTPLFIIFKLTK